jgi:alpha-galactosidase
MLVCGCLCGLVACLTGCVRPRCKNSRAEALRIRDDWNRAHLRGKTQALPFAFAYAGQAAMPALAGWHETQAIQRLDTARLQHTRSWTDPATGLEVRCVAIEYADYPALEWTVYLKNTGTADTPIVEDLQGLAVQFQAAATEPWMLHTIRGDNCTAQSFEPRELTLMAGRAYQFGPAGSGKSCDGPEGWPYFNLQHPGGGVILAIGWPGQWACRVERGAAGPVQVLAGQAKTHLRLKPGEEIRTPLTALVFWSGSDVQEAQNLWRRWFIAHNMPKIEGQPQPPVAQIQIGGAESDIDYVREFLAAGIKPDVCWRDAGAGEMTWYPSDTGPHRGNMAWLNTGTWEVDARKFPNGFRPFSDWVRANGMQFLLWFEPERVGDPQSWLAKNHPAWLLPEGPGGGRILDEGNPEVLKWLIEHVDGLIKTQGLDWYREDMNGDGPLLAWQRNDGPERVGSTENHYVQGHLAYWDALRRRNPKLRIDSCASGGRRNDLETMRRAVPMLRSDYQWPDMGRIAEGNQGHTYGLSAWLPFQGTGVYLYDDYTLRSFYLPSFGMGKLTRENAAKQKQAYDECGRLAPLMLADYYPLTPYSLKDEDWIAWQFNRPGQGDGAVQAFRRAKCAEGTLEVRLRGLEAHARYEVRSLDRPEVQQVMGRELMETGLTVEIGTKPGAAIYFYRKRGD